MLDPTRKLLKTLDEIGALWSWAEPNWALTALSGTDGYGWLDRAMFAALADPPHGTLAPQEPDELDQPAYREKNTPPQDLLKAFLADPGAQAVCDRCGRKNAYDRPARNRLVVRCGYSVVGFYFCDKCRSALGRAIPSLVWG